VLARLNIFLKNALVIERMAGVDTIVLDKTGTLTCADAQGVEFKSADCGLPSEASGRRMGLQSAELSAEEAQWIASLTRHSTHPNSVSITKSLGTGSLPVGGFRETPGCGIEGEVAGHRILLGSSAWLKQRGVICRSRGDEAQIASREKAKPPYVGSYTCMAIDSQLRGAFALANTLRPEVRQLLARLGGRFELALLSGDNEREAARFRKLFGEHTTLRFNQSPADKLNFIRELQHRGRRVMMVGDGLNDAGALQQSDVGVAVVENIGVFSPASDVILDAAQLPRLAEVLAFSQHAAWVVRAGFVISALYNLVGVSIAAAGWLAPMVCAVLMPLSSATVVAFACGTTLWLGRRTFSTPRRPAIIPPSTSLLEPAVKLMEVA
jgi:Cu+-exporting ATPase